MNGAIDLFDNRHASHTNNSLHNKASTNKQASGPMKPAGLQPNIWADPLHSTRLSTIIFTILLATSQE